VWGSVRVWRHTTAEPKQINLLIRVVILQNAADLVDHLKVLVSVHVEIVQRLGWGRWTIWKREVYCDWKVDIATTEYILQERVSLLKEYLLEYHLALTLADQWLWPRFRILLNRLKTSHRRHVVTQVFVASWSLRSEKFKLYLLLDVLIAQICCADCSLIPIDNPAGSRLPNLRLIDWTVLSRRSQPVNDVEEETARLN